jgi:hypothetical protein
MGLCIQEHKNTNTLLIVIYEFSATVLHKVAKLLFSRSGNIYSSRNFFHFKTIHNLRIRDYTVIDGLFKALLNIIFSSPL